ncbi:MAG: ABC transporter permease [Bacteroidota bacterium]
MIGNYFKIAIRQLFKNKTFSAINIIGLSLAIAVCIVVALFVNRENSVDAFHTKNIYRLDEVQKFEGLVAPQKVALSMFPMGPTLKRDFPEVVNYTRIIRSEKRSFLYNNKKIIVPSFMWVDSVFFQMFDFPLLKGNKRNVLGRSGNVVLSESLSKKIFGNTDPLGKPITQGGGDFVQLTVAGIMKDVPETSHLQMDMVAVLTTDVKKEYADNWGGNWVVTYLELSDHANIAKLETQFPAYLKKHIGPGEKDYELFLQPLNEVHSNSSDITHDYVNYQKFDRSNTYVFIIIAFIVLGIGCMNFVNLSTAKSAGRAKEVGIRKTIGAGRWQLAQQFIQESLLFAFIALLLSLGLVRLFLPYLNNLSEHHISYAVLFEPKAICLLLVGTLLVGLLSGAYPALYLSSFIPSKVLKGSVQIGKNKSLGRNILVVCQFAGAIFLIISTVFVIRQLNFMQTNNPGFNKDQVVSITCYENTGENFKKLKQQFLKSPGVSYVTGSFQRLGNNLHQTGIKFTGIGPEREIATSQIRVDRDFLKLYNIKLVAGRDFRESDQGKAFLINETMAKEILKNSPGTPMEKLIGTPFGLYDQDTLGSIIGITKDFNFNSFHNKIETLTISNSDESPFSEISVKVAGNNVNAALKHLENSWKAIVPDTPFEYNFLDEDFKNLYSADMQLSRIVGILSTIAIIIASLGLFGLVTYATEKRVKEIGVRKVFGASVQSITLLLNRDFLKLVVLANAIGWPLAWLVLRKWLENFAFKIELSFWVFLLTAFAATLIAFLTVSFQTIKAAMNNPTKSLRTE